MVFSVEGLNFPASLVVSGCISERARRRTVAVVSMVGYGWGVDVVDATGLDLSIGCEGVEGLDSASAWTPNERPKRRQQEGRGCS